VPTHVSFGPAGRGTTHCARGVANEIDSMAASSRAIRLAWLEEDPISGRIRLSWQAQQDDGTWREDAATIERGERHPLLDLCRRAAMDFIRRDRGTPLDP
jgi:hypothetical protein